MADIKKEEANVTAKKSTKYLGSFRLVTSKAVPIIPVNGVYSPNTEDEIAELEFQVTRGLVTKG